MKVPSFAGPRCAALIASISLIGVVPYVVPRAQSDDLAQTDRSTAAAAAKASGAAAPEYTDQGELRIPSDFQSWVFVGSNLGLEYREDGDKPALREKTEKNADAQLKTANFHNVYINPQAFDHFVKTGQFPERTVLVLDVYKAEQGEPRSVVAQGLFPGKQQEIAIAVKNSSRPDEQKSDWAYYVFPLGQKTAKAFPDKACYDCHLQHAEDDNVWVQFYPVLRAKNASRAR